MRSPRASRVGHWAASEQYCVRRRQSELTSGCCAERWPRKAQSSSSSVSATKAFQLSIVTVSIGLAAPPSDRRERLLEVGAQVLDILDAHRQPHQRITDAERRARLERNGCVGHDGGVLDQAFDAAQALGEREVLHRFEEAP